MRFTKRITPPHLFATLALTTVLLTLGLIVFGAVVRVTDSGLGCGNEWPTCDGRIIPPLDNLTAWIEWSHRLFAVLIGLFGLGMLYVALRAFRKRNRMVVNATLLAAALFFAQSMLGALVVVLDLPPTMVTLHLGTAMLLLGALIMSAVTSWYQPALTYARDHVTLLAFLTAALSLIIILTGALVRGSGATLACTDWPLCNGAVFPFDQGRLQVVHMLHRFAVGGLGLALALLVWYVWQVRQDGTVRLLAAASFGVYLLQALVGAAFVFTEAAPFWGAAHVGMAATTWGLLVMLCVIEVMNSREQAVIDEQDQSETEWTSRSEAVTG